MYVHMYKRRARKGSLKMSQNCGQARIFSFQRFILESNTLQTKLNLQAMLVFIPACQLDFLRKKKKTLFVINVFVIIVLVYIKRHLTRAEPK